MVTNAEELIKQFTPEQKPEYEKTLSLKTTLELQKSETL